MRESLIHYKCSESPDSSLVIRLFQIRRMYVVDRDKHEKSGPATILHRSQLPHRTEQTYQFPLILNENGSFQYPPFNPIMVIKILGKPMKINGLI